MSSARLRCFGGNGVSYPHQESSAIPLVDLNLPLATDIPRDVRAFLREAEHRVERFRDELRAPAFVPSDGAQNYLALRAVAEAGVLEGNLFCEWGSGLGVTTCLAAMLDFDALGIEIEESLVEEARRLAEDFDLPVEFIHGSFLPRGAADCMGEDIFAWLTTDEAGPQECDLGPEDFDLIFAYPWPDEERGLAALFERYARPGAVLASYHGEDGVRLRRKTSRGRRTSQRPGA